MNTHTYAHIHAHTHKHIHTHIRSHDINTILLVWDSIPSPLNCGTTYVSMYLLKPIVFSIIMNNNYTWCITFAGINLL